MQQPNVLSAETLSRIRAMALEEVALLDALEAALEADDTPRVLEVARRICGLEKEVKQ